MYNVKKTNQKKNVSNVGAATIFLKGKSGHEILKY